MLLSAFFILLIVIPGYVYYNYGGTVNLDDNGIHIHNRRVFGHHLNENILAKQLPSLVSRTMELQELRCETQEEIDMVKKIAKYPEVADMMPKNLTRSTSELNPLPNILIIGHILRLDEVNEECFK